MLRGAVWDKNDPRCWRATCDKASSWLVCCSIFREFSMLGVGRPAVFTFPWVRFRGASLFQAPLRWPYRYSQLAIWLIFSLVIVWIIFLSNTFIGFRPDNNVEQLLQIFNNLPIRKYKCFSWGIKHYCLKNCRGQKWPKQLRGVRHKIQSWLACHLCLVIPYWYSVLRREISSFFLLQPAVSCSIFVYKVSHIAISS